MNQGQYVDYWRTKLSNAYQHRTRYPHGLARHMSVKHPLKALRGWLEEAEKNPDGSPIAHPAIYVLELP